MTAKLTLITAPLAVSWVTANITVFSKPQGEAGGDWKEGLCSVATVAVRCHRKRTPSFLSLASVHSLEPSTDYFCTF